MTGHVWSSEVVYRYAMLCNGVRGHAGYFRSFRVIRGHVKLIVSMEGYFRSSCKVSRGHLGSLEVIGAAVIVSCSSAYFTVLLSFVVIL